MKILSIFILLFILSASSFGQQTFTLKGKLTGKDTGLIYLTYYNDKTGQEVKDSSSIVRGQFYFSDDIDRPEFAILSFSPQTNFNNSNVKQFYIEPSNISIEIKGSDLKNAIVEGSETQDDADALKRTKDTAWAGSAYEQELVRKAKLTYIDALHQKKSADILDSLNYRCDSLNDLLEPYSKKERIAIFTFIEQHPSSYISVEALGQNTIYFTIDSLKYLFKLIDTNLQMSGTGHRIENYIRDIEAVSPGKMANDFTTIDFDGNALKLSDFRGNYVLLDFWASWCAPCRKATPHLKHLFNQYKDKAFTVIAISDNDTDTAAWRKAIIKDGSDIWYNVLRGRNPNFSINQILRGEKDENDIHSKFGIALLPTKILIDPNGIIIGRFVGSESGPEMDKVLAKIMK